MTDLDSAKQFRDRLSRHVTRYAQYMSSAAADPVVEAQIEAEKTWLNREYGRLLPIINRHGPMGMRNPMLGLMSQDVIRDAINDSGHPWSWDAARLAMEHVDMAIGRLEGELSRSDAEAIYRLTSPVYWFRSLIRSVRRLLRTTRGKIAGVVGALLLVVIGAIVGGWASAFFDRVLGH